MGNITGAMVFQSTIPTVVALVFASSTLGRPSEGSYVAFASAGIAFLSSAVDLHPDGPPRGSARPVACSSAARSTRPTCVLVIGVGRWAPSAEPPEVR